MRLWWIHRDEDVCDETEEIFNTDTLVFVTVRVSKVAHSAGEWRASLFQDESLPILDQVHLDDAASSAVGLVVVDVKPNHKGPSLRCCKGNVSLVDLFAILAA